MKDEEIEVLCPVCRKIHKFKPEVQEFRCKKRHLVLLKDRHGWRLMEVKVITEREDRELDRIWGSKDED